MSGQSSGREGAATPPPFGLFPQPLFMQLGVLSDGLGRQLDVGKARQESPTTTYSARGSQ